MSSSLVCAVRSLISGRIAKVSRQVRQRNRLRVEMLEARLLMHSSPHSGGGTLFEEHEAVMRLIDFDEIHSTASNPVYYIAKDGDSNPNTTNLWSDLSNWSKATFNTSTSSFVISAAEHLPTTGDNIEIPVGLSFTYDVTPDAFNVPTLPGMDPAKTSVKNNMRLRTVGIEGSLSFQPGTDLLMVFETMIVASTGTLNVSSDAEHNVRMLIASPDWSKFSLAEPFDTELDPHQFARGLVSHGTIRMQGEDVTPFITLPQLTRKDNNITPPKPVAGAVAEPGSFKFTVPSGTQTNGWSVGDRIVVSGTDAYRVSSTTGMSSDEEAVITQILPNTDGSTSFFAQVQVAVLQSSDLLAPPTAIKTLGGLQYDHVPPKDPDGQPYIHGGAAAFGIQIANLSRNINIQSENPYHTTARGHTMFMHNSNVTLHGVGFLGLGRSDKRTVVDDVQFYTKEIIDSLNQEAALQTPPGLQIPSSMIGKFIPGTGLNPRGRYSVHFHRAGINEVDGTNPNNPILSESPAASVEGSVVVDSPGWGYVSHTSHVNFDKNIAFNVIGASFVTEAGNEMGRFVGNLAIRGVGANTGEDIESRRLRQDFGFQGDGFWFQGPALRVEDNIAVGQRHAGFVFFTKPMVQDFSWVDPKSSDPNHPTILTARQGAQLTTKMLATAYDAALISELGGIGKSIDPGKVPILSFKNNTALGVGTGFETWFHLLGAKLPRNLGSQISGLKVANTRGAAMFDPYTNLTTVKDTLLVGNPGSPGGVGINRNDVTANFTYDNVTIRGYAVGIAIPENGLNIVSGGTFQNKRNVEITTAKSRTRAVMLNDKFADDGVSIVSPLTFLALPKTADEVTRINVDLRTNYDAEDRNLSKVFNPDIIRMGTVWLNSFALGIQPGNGPKQLYYYQQAADFKPFPEHDSTGAAIDYGGPVKDAFGNVVDYSGIDVPSELFDKSNEELMATYGLSIGGTVAPSGAKDGRGTYPLLNPDGTPSGLTDSPRINGLIGDSSTYHYSLDATSPRYTKAVDTTYPANTDPQYVFSYRFAKPTVGEETSISTVTVRVGNFVPASGYALQLTTLKVNGLLVNVPQPVNPPVRPTPPVLLTGELTANQIAANKSAMDKYNRELASFNTYWTNYYNTPVKLSLREGWNVVTGDLDGTGGMRTQLIYGDTIAPDLNLTSTNKDQLRRLTNSTNPWKPGTWDSNPQTMIGVALGSADQTPKVATVTGQFVAVMNPNDLSFGFALNGHVVDNSFGHKSFEVFIGNLNSYLNTNDPTAPGKLVPYVTPPTDDQGEALPSYANIANHQSFADGTNSTTVVQRLQTIFFAVKDNAGNSKTFALTIYLDPTAPRVGGDSNLSGSSNPSASMIALANQIYVIDTDTFQMINLTDPKKKK